MASWTGANRKYIATQLITQPTARGIASRKTRIQLEKIAVRHTSIRIMVGQAYLGRARRRRNSSGSCSSSGTMGLSSNALAVTALLSWRAGGRTRQKSIFVTPFRHKSPAGRFIPLFHSLARTADETYLHKCLTKGYYLMPMKGMDDDSAVRCQQAFIRLLAETPLAGLRMAEVAT